METITNKSSLVKMVKYACENVEYYKKYANGGEMNNEDIYVKLPFLYKNQIINEPSAFLSQKYKADMNARKLLRKFTSGSTGDCLAVYWDKFSDTLSNLAVWKYRKNWYGVDINSKYLTFHINTGESFAGDPEQYSYNASHNHLSISRLSLSSFNLDWISKVVTSFRPEWILAYPSILFVFTELMKRVKCESFFENVKYIELMGEYVQDGFLEYLKKIYKNAKIADMYGCTEVGTIALQCPHGYRHIVSKNVFVETINDKIVVTGLQNAAMPVIKYIVGDYGKIEHKKCKCGCKEPIIELQSRTTKFIVLPNGSSLHAHIILYIVKKINSENHSAIIKFKAVQKTVSDIIVYVSLKPGFESWLKSLQIQFNEISNKVIGENMHWTLCLLSIEDIDTCKKNDFFDTELEMEKYEVPRSFDEIAL